jgi:hypothetical protein
LQTRPDRADQALTLVRSVVGTLCALFVAAERKAAKDNLIGGFAPALTATASCSTTSPASPGTTTAGLRLDTWTQAIDKVTVPSGGFWPRCSLKMVTVVLGAGVTGDAGAVKNGGLLRRRTSVNMWRLGAEIDPQRSSPGPIAVFDASCGQLLPPNLHCFFG